MMDLPKDPIGFLLVVMPAFVLESSVKSQHLFADSRHLTIFQHLSETETNQKPEKTDLPKDPIGFLFVVMPAFVLASSSMDVDSEEGYSKTCVKLSLNVMFLCKKNGNSIRKTEQLCGTNNSIA